MREGTLMGTGKIPLWYWVHPVEGARAACLLVHGVGEHSGRYRHVADVLNCCGLTVWAMDYRGHGRAGGRRGHCEAFRELLDDVHQVLTRMRADAPELPAVLIGHSLGGLLVLAYALESPAAVRAVVASSPALALAVPPPRLKVWMAHTLGRWWPALTVRNGVRPAWLSHDPAVATAYHADPLVHPFISIGGYLAIRQAMVLTRARAAQMAVPCLILQAGDDHLVSIEASRRFAAQVRSPGSAIRVYPGMFHELFNEVGRQQVFDDLCQWLAARLN